MNKTIHIACKTGFTAPLDAFNEFQGDLKELTEVNFSKLAKEIEDTGFAFAPHMWTNPEDNKLYTCDGHQRLHTVRRMVG